MEQHALSILVVLARDYHRSSISARRGLFLHVLLIFLLVVLTHVRLGNLGVEAFLRRHDGHLDGLLHLGFLFLFLHLLRLWSNLKHYLRVLGGYFRSAGLAYEYGGLAAVHVLDQRGASHDEILVLERHAVLKARARVVDRSGLSRCRWAYRALVERPLWERLLRAVRRHQLHAHFNLRGLLLDFRDIVAAIWWAQ